MRIQLYEYGAGIDVNELQRHNSSLREIYSGIESANSRIRHVLRTNRDALVISDGKIRALGVAGVIRLTKAIDLEIVPKFLSSVRDSAWKSPLYLLSVLSKHGAVLSSDHVLASTSYTEALYDIAGRMLARLYYENHRKLIRQYRKEIFHDYAIDGEIDFDSIFEKQNDGIKQSKVLFDIINGYNATISLAMRITLPYIRDNSIKNQLQTAIVELGPQKKPPLQKLHVPQRNKEWCDIYNLSYDITRGLANSFDSGQIAAPGFIVNTWQLWEWLLTAGMRLGNEPSVAAQQAMIWGEKKFGSHHTAVNVYPDISVYTASNHKVCYLMDAKYKNLSNPTTGEIERADLYEAFAFCDAVGVNLLFLAYPESNSISQVPGKVRIQSQYNVGGKTIVVITVSFGLLDEKGGIYAFAKNLQKGINAIITDLNDASETQKQ